MFRKHLLLLFFIFRFFFGFAQDTAKIDTILVLSGRMPSLLSESPRMMQVVSSIDLKSAPVHSNDDFLDYLPSADLRSRAGLGAQGDLSIRGANYEQTLVMLDGVPLTDLQTGHHNLNLPIPAEMCGGVELTSSGASRIFGPKAMAGAVNFTSIFPNKNSAFASVFLGQHGFRRLSAGFSVVKNGWGIQLGAQNLSHNGYAVNTDFDHKNLYAKFYRKTKQGTVWLNMAKGNKRFGAQNFYSSLFPWQHEYLATHFVALVWNYKLKNWHFNGNVSYRYNHDRFELYREGEGWYKPIGMRYIRGVDSAASWYKGHNYHLTRSRGMIFNVSRQLGIQQLTLGIEYRRESILSNVLGTLADTIPVKFGPEDARFTKSGERNNFSLFAEDKVLWKKWQIAAGILLNSNRAYGNSLFPGIEIARIIGPGRLFASANKSFRFPTFTELYYNRGGAIGSIDLKPEIAMCYELGAEIKYKSFQFQGALFARNGNNLIDWVRLNGSSITTATNLTKVLYYGLDANIKYVPTKTQSGFIKQIVFGVLIMNANNNSSGFESNYALDFIQYKLTSGLRFAFNKKLNANLLVYAQNRRGGFFKPGSTSETPFGWNMSADVRISYTIKKTSLFLEGTNLLNNNLTDIGNVILPGRWIKGGINITL